MTDLNTYTDEDLTGYLDGELPQDRAAALATALAADPVLAARLQSLRLPKAVLRAGFDSLLVAAPAFPLSAAAPARGLRGLAAAVAVCTVLGAGLWAARPQPRDWMEYVAAYQRLYVPATLADIAPNDTEASAQLADLSQRLGLDLADVRIKDGWTFKRGQVLGFQGALLVQLAFQTADGTPVALCILRDASQVAQPFDAGQTEGLQTVAWARAGYGFFLIGGTEANALIAAAQKFEAAI